MTGVQADLDLLFQMVDDMHAQYMEMDKGDDQLLNAQRESIDRIRKHADDIVRLIESKEGGLA